MDLSSALSSSLASPVGRAAVLTGLEGVALVVAGIAYAVAGTSSAASTAGAEVGAVLIVAVGVLVLLTAVGLARRRHWARSPVVVLQVIGALTAADVLRTPLWPVAVAVLVVVAGVVSQLVLPEAREAFRRG